MVTRCVWWLPDQEFTLSLPHLQLCPGTRFEQCPGTRFEPVSGSTAQLLGSLEAAAAGGSTAVGVAPPVRICTRPGSPRVGSAPAGRPTKRPRAARGDPPWSLPNARPVPRTLGRQSAPISRLGCWWDETWHVSTATTSQEVAPRLLARKLAPTLALGNRAGRSSAPPATPTGPAPPPRPSICGSLRSAGLIDAKSIDLRRLVPRGAQLTWHALSCLK
eukprot:COSAG06_NODE_56_length_27627_cov_106.527136_15_plen_218_part_00